MPGIFGDGQRGGIFGAKIDPRLQAEEMRRRRIAEAFAAAEEGAQEPSKALYEAKHRRAQGLPPETSFWEDVASLGPRAWGGAQKMWQAAPMAAEALWNDPLGSINRAGMAGQAATDAIVQGAVRPFTQFGDPNVDPMQQGADLGLTAMGMSSVVPAEANALRMGIKAYHGSPHDFERFDSSKIGTGEGAQAYGHGMYFAEREGTAKDYRNRLAPSAPDDVSPDAAAQAKFEPEWRKLVEELGPTRDRRDRLYHTGEYQLNGAAEFQQLDKRVGEIDTQMNALHQQMVDDTIARNPHLLKGRMYEVDIAADPEHFLDWDKPLSEQSPQVQQAALGTANPPDPNALRKRAETASNAEKQFLLNQADYLENQLKMHGEGWHGSAVAENLPSEWDDFETARRIARAKVAEQLKERGAAGIRYLDQGSRVNLANLPKNPMTDEAKKWLEAHGNDADAAVKAFHQHQRDTGYKDWNTTERDEIADVIRKSVQPQTSNYVVFDDKLISILKKYGLPISAAGLAALSQLHPEEARAAQQKGKR